MAFLLYPAPSFLLAVSSFGDMLKNGPIYLASFLFVLGVLVFVHEFGHYAVAKFFRVRVEVFSLGFGKRLWGFRRGDTDYRISALPLGGYVKMSGENPMEEHTGDPGEFTSHPRWQRFLIAIAGPVMNIILAVVVLTGLYMHHHGYAASMKAPVDVVWVTPDSAAAKAGLQKGDRIVKLQGIQDPTWEQVRKAELIPEPLALTVRRGDRTLEVTATPDIKGPNRVGDLGVVYPEVVATVEAGRPAQLAGVKAGDVLVSVDETPIKGFEDLFDSLQATKGKEVKLAVLRNGTELKMAVTPQILQGTSDDKYRIGLTTTVVEKLAFPTAFRTAVMDCEENSSLIFKLLRRLVQRHPPIEQLSGPIGIMKASGQAAKTSFPTLLYLMALISLNLAVVNLLPIPILDGGLMLMLLIEGTMRRDIRIEIKERVYQAAFVMLLLFFVMITYFDLAKSFHS